MSFESLPTAHRDTLTNLPNLIVIRETLERAIAKQPGGFGLAELDIDGFKQINDRYGHGAGDIILQRVAAVLSQNLREEDKFLPARRSGDEFSIIIGGAKTDEQVAAVCERIRHLLTEAICQPLPIQPNTALDLGVSIGGRVHKVGETAEELQVAADQLMRNDKAKRKIDHHNDPKKREFIRSVARVSFELGISQRDLAILVELHRKGLY